VFFILRQRLTGQCKEDKSSAWAKNRRVQQGCRSDRRFHGNRAKRLPEFSADHGARVVLLSRDAGRAKPPATGLVTPSAHLALSCDVRNREEIDRVLSLTLHHFNRIDVWINNAGHGLLDSVAQLDMTACRETVDTNFSALLNHAGSPFRHEAARRGHDY